LQVISGVRSAFGRSSNFTVIADAAGTASVLRL
jgi:hypothetical protein